MARRVIWARIRGTLTYFVLLPGVTIGGGLLLDRWAQCSLDAGAARYPVAALLLVAGGAVMSWAAYTLVHHGEGTPSPEAPPKNLVTRGPYRYVRHPIFLGYFLCGGAVALWLESPGLLLIGLPALILGSVLYLRREERILRGRFGEAYERYRKASCFLLPPFL